MGHLQDGKGLLDQQCQHRICQQSCIADGFYIKFLKISINLFSIPPINALSPSKDHINRLSSFIQILLGPLVIATFLLFFSLVIFPKVCLLPQKDFKDRQEN